MWIFATVERELGRGSNALTVFFGRPSGILMACEGEQREKYLLPLSQVRNLMLPALTEPAGLMCAVCNVPPSRMGMIGSSMVPATSLLPPRYRRFCDCLCCHR